MQVVADEREVRIRNWTFEWTVAESGDTSFEIVKTDDTLYILLRSGYDKDESEDI
jgi:hypothetical protein